MKRIFISSVQQEFAEVRKLLKRYITRNPALTAEELYREHSSFPNNPIIADPLFYTKHIEKLGSGLTDLLEDCRVAGLPQPQIDVTMGTFKITIFRRDKIAAMPNEPLNEPLNIIGASELTAEIYTLICTKPGIKQKEIRSEVRRSIATVKRQIELLVGYVEHRGSKKTGGYYKVSNPKARDTGAVQDGFVLDIG